MDSWRAKAYYCFWLSCCFRVQCVEESSFITTSSDTTEIWKLPWPLEYNQLYIYKLIFCYLIQVLLNILLLLDLVSA